MGTQESPPFQSFSHIKNVAGRCYCIDVVTRPVQAHSNRPAAGVGTPGQGLLLPCPGCAPRGPQKQGAVWGPYHGPEAPHPGDADKQKSCCAPTHLRGACVLVQSQGVAGECHTGGRGVEGGAERERGRRGVQSFLIDLPASPLETLRLALQQVQIKLYLKKQKRVLEGRGQGHGSTVGGEKGRRGLNCRLGHSQLFLPIAQPSPVKGEMPRTLPLLKIPSEPCYSQK